MGEREEEHWSRAKRIMMALGVAFAILTVSIVAFALVAEGTYTAKNFKSHTPIYIDGNVHIWSEEGVTAGSGTETDPFVIEGWEILGVGASGISINNTDAHIVIRNVSVSGTWSSRATSSSSVGISLDNASNVRIESSFISGFQSGVRANGTLGVTEGIEISRSTFTSNGQNVVISGTSDCLVTHSFFNGYDESLLHISNCTSVSCSFNNIVGASYTYMSSRTSVVLIENVTDCILEENDIGAFSDSKCVRLIDTKSAMITNNSIMSYGQYGLVAERCTGLMLCRNEISSGEGIWVQGSVNAVVDGNYLHSGLYRSGSLSIYSSNSVNATISNNLIIRGGGIVVSNSRDCIVNDNYVEDAGYFGSYGYLRFMTGMVTYKCQNLTITRNLFVNGSGPGATLSGMNITFDGNMISNNSRLADYYTNEGRGLTATGSGLSIRNNRISSNTREGLGPGNGVMLQMCDDSTFESNNISDDVDLRYCDNLTVRSNTFDGMWNLSVLSWTDVTTLDENNFAAGIAISSTGDSSVTHWDAGYPEGGNYWQSYYGEDLMNGLNQDLPGPDGFGDTAYQISGGFLDRYPRMQPVRLQDFQSPVTFAICNGTLGLRYWYTSNVSVALTSFDDNSSSVDISYSLDSGPWNTYNTNVLVTGDGIHTLQYRSVDRQGNIERTKTVQIRVDTQAPFLTTSLLKEYRFRTQTSDTRYIRANFTDGTSGVDYSFTTYNSTIYGYPYSMYSAGDWYPIIPETGTRDGAIVVLDGAGNSFTHVITIKASIAPSTDPISHEGPYGWWLILAILVDTGVGLTALGAFASSREKGLPGGKWTPRTEGERHYDEDVIDGYGKFKRQV